MARYELTPWGNKDSSFFPFKGMRDFQNEMDRLFEDFFPERRRKGQEELNFLPPCDIEEKEDHYLLTMDLPGMKKENVRIEMNAGQIVISGERKSETKSEEKGGGGKYTERSYGNFRRAFTVPENLDAENIEAQFENGVLSLYMPKKERSPAKQIPIEAKKEGFFSKMLGKIESGSKQ